MDRQTSARIMRHGLGYAAIAAAIFGSVFVVAVWFG